MKNSNFFILFFFLNLINNNIFADDLFPPGVDSQETICNGRVAKYSPKATVVFRYPNTKGLPIDMAADQKSNRLKTVRILLKEGYFSQYYFESDANFDQVDGYWESIGKDHHDLASIKKDRDDMSLHGKHPSFHDPLDPTLTKLRATYTMRIPIKTLKSVFKMPDESRWQHMGYEYNTLIWAPSSALVNVDSIWEEYLYHMTTVTETAKESGETVFQIQLDLNLFCQTAVKMTSLISD